MERRFIVRLQNTRRGSGGRPMALTEESAAGGGGTGGERGAMGGACCHCSKRGGKTPSQCASRSAAGRSLRAAPRDVVAAGIMPLRPYESWPDRERAGKLGPSWAGHVAGSGLVFRVWLEGRSCSGELLHGGVVA